MKNNIVYLPNSGDDCHIEIPQTELFLESTKKLSTFIENLPLNYTDNTLLIEKLLDHTKLTQKEGFLSGFDLGMKLGKKLNKEKNA